MSDERREWMELVASLRAENERLQLEVSKLHTECGHKEADVKELRAELARLRPLAAPVWPDEEGEDS